MTARQHIQLRRDTAANWAAANPVLLAGEAGFDVDAQRLKIGDGVNHWNALPYISSGNLSFDGLSNVNTSARVDGSVLYYDQPSGKYVADGVVTRLGLVDGANF